MSNFLIRKALDRFMDEVVGQAPTDFGLLKIVHGNVADDGTTAVAPWLEVHYMPAPVQTIDLQMKTRIYSGVYQITVKFPANMGTQAAFQIADTIADLFAAIDWLETDEDPNTGAPLRIMLTEPVSQAQGLTHDAGYDVPLSVYYRVMK